MAIPAAARLSSYINKRDPNQGTCTNACRWNITCRNGKEDVVSNIVHKHEPIQYRTLSRRSVHRRAPTDKVFMIEEAQRPGGLTAFEDEHGTYIMNSKDLRYRPRGAPERKHRASLALKIEAAPNPFYYCARTAQVSTVRPSTTPPRVNPDPTLLETLEGLAHRGIPGFPSPYARRLPELQYGYSVRTPAICRRVHR
ncbi:U32 family peptidase [Salmonella enterica subsp. enterica serovar Weltevreden]|nr:U32 family peptidase [Salmonella enterica subsp. enterica serovar Weltevreden]